jgi:metallo-beta-lactamase family protein
MVRIHKGEVAVLAEIASLKGMSGHADAAEMVRWLAAIDRPPKAVFLTHGEKDAAEALAARIAKERGFRTHVPSLGETVELEPGTPA